MFRTVRRSVVCVVLALLALSVVPLVRGQDAAAPGKATAAKQTPLVTVTKADASVVRGRLMSSDPEQVTLQLVVAGKPAAEGETVSVAWREITRVSNGLTRAKAVEAFKAAHVGQLCGTCHGNAMTACGTCKGTAHDPAAGKDCKTCGGELLVDCKAPKCADGKMPCPKPCLKKDVGGWTMKDGEKMRLFRAKKGSTSMYFSERHVGELIYVKNGEVVNEGKCTTCGGTSIAVCAACGGNGKSACRTCATRKDAPPCPATCDKGQSPCTACGGKGLKKA